MTARIRTAARHRAVGLLCAGGMLFQFGGCEFGDITTSTTLNGREVITSLLRGAILTPIDQFITTAVNEFFGDQ